MSKRNELDLDHNHIDTSVSLLKSIVALAPHFGTAFAEIVGMTIPHQRMDRFKVYILNLDKELHERLDLVEEVQVGLLQITNILCEPRNADFIEQGAIQASRALSEERIKYIANCVADGISKNTSDQIKEKRLLNLLKKLDDEEIIMLMSHHEKYRNLDVTHSLKPVPSYLGAGHENARLNNLFTLGYKNLENWGLLQTRYPSLKVGETPVFDKSTGGFKGGSRDITYLGRTLLKSIGLVENEFNN